MASPDPSRESKWTPVPTGPWVDSELSVPLLEDSGFSLRADDLLIYSTGFTLRLIGHGRGNWPGVIAIKDNQLPWEQIEVEIQFANGRAARLNDSAGLKSGAGPVVTWNSCKSGWTDDSGNESFEFILWIWPLPPLGPVTLLIDWPHIGLRGGQVLLEGSKRRRVATQLPPPSTST